MLLNQNPVVSNKFELCPRYLDTLRTFCTLFNGRFKTNIVLYAFIKLFWVQPLHLKRPL